MKSFSVRKAYSLTVIVAFLVLLSSCQTQSFQFRKAKNEDTIESYELFLEAYPDGRYSSKVKLLLEDLEFHIADSTGTSESYKSFIEKYPEGQYIDQTRLLLEESFFIEVKSTNTKESFHSFLQMFPASKFNAQVKSGYISIMIEEIYQDAAKDPLGDIKSNFRKSLSGEISHQEHQRRTIENRNTVIAFNNKTSEIVQADSLLSGYFNDLIARMPNSGKITLDNMNYWSSDLREILEKDLGVEIID